MGYEIGFTPEDVLVRIRYRSVKPLNESAQEILSNVLKAQLKLDKSALISNRSSRPRRQRNRLVVRTTGEEMTGPIPIFSTFLISSMVRHFRPTTEDKPV